MSADVIREIEARDAERVRATLTNDLDALAGVFADGLRYTHGSAAVDSKSQYLDNLRHGVYAYRSLTDIERGFQVHGDTVLVFGDVRIDVIAKGTPKVFVSRYLAVWLREDGQWKLGAWQSTPVPA